LAADTYQRRVKDWLSRYKRQTLGVSENGVWLQNGQPYSHILPIAERKLNILASFRNEFWTWFNHQAIELHREFPVSMHDNGRARLIADHRHCMRVWNPVVIRSQGPADNRLNAQNEVVVSTDELSSHHLGRAIELICRFAHLQRARRIEAGGISVNSSLCSRSGWIRAPSHRSALRKSLSRSLVENLRE
jgi:hypothetical protein